MTFATRSLAGRALASRLIPLHLENPVVLALPRGGVPIGVEVASGLGVPLHLLVVRKIGTPGHAELAMGAVTTDGTTVRNEDLIRRLGVDEATFQVHAASARAEAVARTGRYRSVAMPDLTGRVVVVVDDGVATGATMRAALTLVRLAHPSRLVAAVPVGDSATCDALEDVADAVVCVHRPSVMHAVARFYDDFHQVADEEVLMLLASMGPRRRS